MYKTLQTGDKNKNKKYHTVATVPKFNREKWHE
jgi:hypothetical protein